MRPHQPSRDVYSIRKISKLVSIQASKYHNRVRILRDGWQNLPDEAYYRILKEIRLEIFTNLHSGLRGLYSPRIARKWFKHISMLTINERSHTFTPGSPVSIRYITGICEGLWDIIFTETGNTDYVSS